MATLKQQRIEQKLTQKQVAKEVGISERQYIRIENGERLTNIDTAYRIAKLFKTTIEECFKDYFNSI
jgi:putative transcriptional regulator